MKLPVSWLKEYVPIAVPLEELAHRLTMAGLEVSSVTRTGGDWQNVTVARVVAVEKHPNADKLKLATVDLGGEQMTVVCGAPNVAAGQKVAFARVGARLIDPRTGQPRKLEQAKIRGVLSAGMVCSEAELGLSKEHEGILELPADAPVGAPLADYMGDAVFDFSITPNRPDGLSVLGIAREAAAIQSVAVAEPPIAYEERGGPIAGQAAIEIAAPDLCPRYCASLVAGVKVGASPKWMQDRLAAAGMRPINNIVDITNYVMLEFGQPLHAFDFATLRGGKVIVRRGKPGERITTLDGVERTLDGEMLVIADAVAPVALAGVMGGAATEVTGATATVLLESANFLNASIRRTSALTK
ncbi:MAG: phenylalanine--tRNA ligase subunit beta, partial [Chloroflexi bacterium]|nr:phenylalanine--tRNA ligase subunit beta [Chloroflexota bacterium]